MAQEYSGFVNATFESKHGPDKGQPAFFLKGTKGVFTVPDEFDASKISKGTKIEFTAAPLKQGGFRVKSQPKVLATAGSSQYSGGTGSSQYSGGSKSNVDYNAAVARAIDGAALLVRAGGLKLSKTKTEENRTILLETVDELTAKFFKDIESKEVLKKAQYISGEAGDEEEDESDEADEVQDDDELGATWDNAA